MPLISLMWPTTSTTASWTSSWKQVAVATTAIAVTTLAYRAARTWSDGRRLERTRRAKREACRRAVDDLAARVNWKLSQRGGVSRDDEGDETKTVIEHQGTVVCS
jgi:hypothetical protein